MTDHARAGEPLFVLVLVVEIRKTIPEQSVEATPPWAGNGHKEVLQYVRDGWGWPPCSVRLSLLLHFFHGEFT